MRKLLTILAACVALVAIITAVAPAQDKGRSKIAPPLRAKHVPEVTDILGNLTVDTPRTHKNMIVFPIRWSGKQAPGTWETMDQAVAAEHLKITEKQQASVPQVKIENSGVKTVFLMSGEIIKGGKQTRVIRKDTIIETRQIVSVPVFCVEKGRWAGKAEFKRSANAAPAKIRDSMNRGADQSTVWRHVGKYNDAAGASPRSGSLDEGLNSNKAKAVQQETRKKLGKFSPPDTIGLAFADLRTGRVIGLELFGRRDLFAELQEKIIQGYTMDIVLPAERWNARDAKPVAKKDVEAFIARALAGTSRYEDTPGSGRGIDVTAGTLKGKGVATGGKAMHVSIQDSRPDPTPARPIVVPQRRR